jgi:hypothetical protein
LIVTMSMISLLGRILPAEQFGAAVSNRPDI